VAIPVLSRRSALRGSIVAALGAVAGYLTTRTHLPAEAGSAANAYGPTAGTGSRLLVSLDRVPRGGGLVLGEDKVVLTRPSDDEVHAFSAVCTHQGCTVATVAAGTIRCPCHGSRFDAATGAVVNGPAARPLPPVEVTVRSGEVFTS
jgi:Rieske Fe-S protein